MVAKYFSGSDRRSTWKDANWSEDRRGHPRFPARLPLADRSGEDEFTDPDGLPMVPIGAYERRGGWEGSQLSQGARCPTRRTGYW